MVSWTQSRGQRIRPAAACRSQRHVRGARTHAHCALFEGPTAALLGPVMNIDMSAALEERRATLAGNLGSDAFRLNANGLVDLSDNSFDDLKLAFVLLKPSAMAENLRGSGLRALLTLDGKFATPRVEYLVNANRLVMNDMGLDNLRASGKRRLMPSGSRSRSKPAFRASRVSIRWRAARCATSGWPAISRSTGRGSCRTICASVQTGSTPGWSCSPTRLPGSTLAPSTAGSTTTGSKASASSTSKPMSTCNRKAAVSALAGRVRARSTSLFNEGVRDFLGGNLVAGSDVRYGSDGIVRFSNLSLRAGGADHRGQRFLRARRAAGA